MVARGVFITGTDTGVGKTFIAAGLLAAARRAGVDAVPMKPVQTGCVRKGRNWVAPDLEACLAAAGYEALPEERARMAPYCFGPACSPHLAAGRAGVTLSLARLKGAFRSLARDHEGVIAEGAGGVLVPLGPRLSMLDVMKAFGLPVVLVARPGLGTLNHTLLSLAALRAAQVPVAGVVVNEAVPGRWGMIERDNIRTIERLGQVPVFGCVRHGLSRTHLDRVFRDLWRELAGATGSACASSAGQAPASRSSPRTKAVATCRARSL